MTSSQACQRSVLLPCSSQTTVLIAAVCKITMFWHPEGNTLIFELLYDKGRALASLSTGVRHVDRKKGEPGEFPLKSRRESVVYDKRQEAKTTGRMAPQTIYVT